jgi:hypothetical protein
MSLSDAQIRALEDFAQPGGHGYGEFAYLSRATARVLARRGFVTLGTRDVGDRRIAWGWATRDGLDALRQLRG